MLRGGYFLSVICYLQYLLLTILSYSVISSVNLASSQCVRQPHPSSFDQFSPEFFGGVVEGELLTTQMVDRGIALQVKEQVIVEAHLFWLLLIEDNRIKEFY